MNFLKKIPVSTNGIQLKDFKFKPLYERSNDRLLSWSTLFMAFYQQKVSKNEMLQQFGVSANGIYQWDFLKAAVLKPL